MALLRLSSSRWKTLTERLSSSMTPSCYVSDMQKMGMAWPSLSLCSSPFHRITTSLSSRTTGHMRKLVCPYHSSISSFQRNSLPLPLLACRPPLSALYNKEFEGIYSSTIQTFNKIRKQVFQALYTSDENVFIGAPTGSGKTICAEFALPRLWGKREQPIFQTSSQPLDSKNDDIR